MHRCLFESQLATMFPELDISDERLQLSLSHLRELCSLGQSFPVLPASMIVLAQMILGT